MINILRVLVTAIGITFCSIVAATTYYVSPSGSNSNPGTLYAPWTTWDKAFSTATTGDTVFFRGGIYYKPNASSYYVMNDGTANNHIVFANYPGEKPILDCGRYRPTTNYNEPIYVSGKSYIDLIGLTVRNVLQPGGDYGNGIKGFYFYDGNEVRAINCVAHNVSGIGFISNWSTSGGAGKHYFINCDSYNIIDTLSAEGYTAGRGTGFRCSHLGGTLPLGETYFIDCRAWNCSDQGFSLIFDAHSFALGCWSFDNGYYAEGVTDTGMGNGFKLGDSFIDTDGLKRTVTNCIAAYNKFCGITTNENHADYSGRMNVYNNTLYMNGTGGEYSGYGFYILDADGATQEVETNRRIFKNNIVYASAGQDVFVASGAGWTNEYNSWNNPPNIIIDDTDFAALPSTRSNGIALLSSARQSDGSLPDLGNYFKLSSSSKAIDKGINVGLPYNGSAPDLGNSEVVSEQVPSNPIYVSSSIENAAPARLELTYSFTLANVVPAASAFSVRVNNVVRTVSTVAISGTKVLLTLASPVVYGDAVTVAYTKPASNPIQTAAGGQAASISAQNVTNNITAPNSPVFSSASVENATPARVDMTYNLTLASIVPAASAFAVRVNSVARTVSSVAISGTRVQLTLASPVVYGDAVTVAYTKPPSNPIQTAAGGQAASISAQNVTNNVVAVNKPPYIYLSSPTKSSSYVAPATITINAVASDPDGAVVKVEFYYGTIKLGEVGSAPYSFTWKNVPEGNYTITAVASDNQNQRTASGAVIVIVEKSATSVNQSPIVKIVSPSKGKNRKYKRGESVIIVAEATDPDGAISKVEFKNGSLVLAQDVTAPYSFTYEPADTGAIVITASATDNDGTTTVSDGLQLMIVFPIDNFSDYLYLYPNPNDGRFAVEVGPEIPDGSHIIKIVNLSGIVVQEAVMSDHERRKDIDITGCPAGSYILMLVNSDGIFMTRKILKR